jgi:hypothetical protein
MVQTFRPAFLTLALLMGAAPAFAQGTAAPAPAAGGTQRPVAAAPATPTNPGGQTAARPATPAAGASTQGSAQGTVQGQAPARPAQPSGTAATTPAPTAPRTN